MSPLRTLKPPINTLHTLTSSLYRSAAGYRINYPANYTPYYKVNYTTMASTTTKAITFIEKGTAAITDVPIPKLRDGYVLVKVNAVALNPTDWKHIDYARAGPGTKLGCDYAGVVEEVGTNVERTFRKGDRISGVAHGGDITQIENGTFSQYIVVKGDVQIKTPSTFTDNEAATLGVSVFTVGQGLYKSLGLPLPVKGAKDGRFILINGGSTATGIYGIQFAKLSGLRVVATASPRNFDYVKSLGAEAVFDYNSPTVASDIREYTENKLEFAWDTTGSGGAISAGALSSNGGKYGTIIPVERETLTKINPNVDGPHYTFLYSIFGEPLNKGTPVEAKPDEFEFAKKFSVIVEDLIAEGKLQAPRVILNEEGTGLEGVLKGLDLLRANKVSAGKLVYTL